MSVAASTSSGLGEAVVIGEGTVIEEEVEEVLIECVGEVGSLGFSMGVRMYAEEWRRARGPRTRRGDDGRGVCGRLVVRPSTSPSPIYAMLDFVRSFFFFESIAVNEEREETDALLARLGRRLSTGAPIVLVSSPKMLASMN